uniref:Uncharacterized protein n=1 Tax=Moniliophthora roreri TaxID=221103 RepID=A0A0W0FPF5_MONRR
MIPERCLSTLIPSPSVSSTGLEDEPTGTDTPVLTSTTLVASSPGSHLNPESTNQSPPLLPVPPPNFPTPSFILTPLPIPTSSLRLSQSTPSPVLNPNPQWPTTLEVFKCLRPQFHLNVEHIPTVGGEAVPEGANDLPTASLRSLTPAPTLMMQLVDHVSALCADWSAISPEIARSTCVVDASRLNLDIRLATALTNEGLAALRVDSLIRAQTLCQTVAVMTMNGWYNDEPYKNLGGEC